MQPAETSSSDFRSAFVDLLLAAFPGDQLRNFAALLPAGGKLSERLPGLVASPLSGAHELVELLIEFGSVDEALTLLEQERPNEQVIVNTIRQIPRHEPHETQVREFYNAAPPLPHAYYDRASLASIRYQILSKAHALVGITGPLGVGKSTIAAAVAHSSQARDQYCRICWLAVDQPSNDPISTLQEQLFRQLAGSGDFPTRHWRIGLAALSQQADKALKPGERLLVIIDAIPAPLDNVISALQVSAHATLLVCSENRAALQALGASPIVDPGPMSLEESLDFLSRWLKCGVNELPEAAREIAIAAGGIPLVLAIVGGIVSLAGDRNAEWTALSKDIAEGHIETLKIPGLENADVMGTFRRGLAVLDQTELDNLHDLATMPPDTPASVKTLSVLWQTLNSDEARRRADRLATRSLLHRPREAIYGLHRLPRLVLRALDDQLVQRFRALADRAFPSTPHLVLALLWQDNQIFRELVITAGEQEINRATPQGVTALHQASILGMVDSVRLLLEGGADPRVEDEEGFCPLQAAAQGGNAETIRLLLNQAVDPARKNHGGKTALDIAARHGHVEAVRVIAADPAAVKAARYALAYGAMDGHSDIVDLLLEAGAALDAGEGMSPPLFAASFKGRESIVRKLLEAGAHVDQVSNDQTPLFAAATEGHSAVVQLLIAASASPTWKTATNRTVLHQAAQSGDATIVQCLVDAGATIDPVDKAGVTPLHVAAGLGQTAVLSHLVQGGAQLDRVDGDQWTALHRAVHEEQREAVKALLSLGANPNSLGWRRVTPLLLAVLSASPGVRQTTHFIIDHEGGSFFATYTPANSSALQIVRLLVSAGADVNGADESGSTALHLAISKSSVEFASLLLELGADHLKRDHKGRSALDLVEAASKSAGAEQPLITRMRAIASLLRQ